MKKILSCLILMTVLLCSLGITTYANSVEGVLVSKSSQIAVVGELTNSKGQEAVTLTVYNDDGELIYIDQLMTNGKYEFRFSVDDVSKQYTYNINRYGNVANETVKSLSASNMLGYELRLFDAKSTEIDIIFNNILNLKNEDIEDYVPIIAYYDGTGKLLDCNILEDGEFDFTSEKITFETYPPEGSKTVKAYLWNNMVDMEPHVKAEESSKDKEVTVFFGASNEASNYWPSHIANYYVTRYPDKEYVFVNAGIGGQTAGNGFTRIDWDVLSENPDRVIISFGTNDMGRDLYAVEETSEIKAQKETNINKCITNLENIIVKLQENNVREIILTTPSYFDNGAYSTQDVNLGVNDGLGVLAERIKALAEEYNLKVLDSYAITKDITDKTRATGYNGMLLKYPDRLHFNPVGGLALMYKYVKDLGLSEVVSNVCIDASNGEVKAENANVSINSCTSDRIEYKYRAESLPLGVCENYAEAKRIFVGTDLADINKEIIKVTGLSDGEYSVMFDGIELLTCTDKDLANGINIAENVKNPGQIKARKIAEIIWENNTSVSSMKTDRGAAKQAMYEDGILGDYKAVYDMDNSATKDKYMVYINGEKTINRNVRTAQYEAETEQYTVVIEKK